MGWYKGARIGLEAEIKVTFKTGKFQKAVNPAPCTIKVETPVHDRIRELATCECKEHEVKS